MSRLLRCCVESARVGEVANGDHHIYVVLVSDAGERVSHELPITEEGAAHINNLLDAVDVPRRDFWSESITIDPGELDTPRAILDVGGRALVGATVTVLVRDDSPELERIRYLLNEPGSLR